MFGKTIHLFYRVQHLLVVRVNFLGNVLVHNLMQHTIRQNLHVKLIGSVI